MSQPDISLSYQDIDRFSADVTSYGSPDSIRSLSVQVAQPTLTSFEPDDVERHLCDYVRIILPRMQHVRLHLRSVCAALLGNISDGNNELAPVSLPNLKALLIVCKKTYANAHICCVAAPTQTPASTHYVDSWDSVTFGLESLAQAGEVPGRLRPDAKLIVLTSTSSDNSDKSIYATRIRAEGVRLPAAVTAEWGVEAELMPLEDVEVWRAANPRKMTLLWYNEGLCGERLLDCETRSGNTYLSRDSLVERTPAGWQRPDVFMKAQHEPLNG
ncbi:hypothetical protein N0V88_007183 [Collariella sp. IMI 366227]|nr:hypothetical protein N0V88_007183 [Collariella sp. IMI 366227]